MCVCAALLLAVARDLTAASSRAALVLYVMASLGAARRAAALPRRNARSNDNTRRQQPRRSRGARRAATLASQGYKLETYFAWLLKQVRFTLHCPAHSPSSIFNTGAGNSLYPLRTQGLLYRLLSGGCEAHVASDALAEPGTTSRVVVPCGAVNIASRPVGNAIDPRRKPLRMRQAAKPSKLGLCVKQRRQAGLQARAERTRSPPEHPPMHSLTRCCCTPHCCIASHRPRGSHHAGARVG